MNCPACDHVNADAARYCAKCGALLPVAHVAGSDPMIGSVVGGRYRITGLLGEGGMGRVYIAEQQMGTAVRKVAVKTLLQEFSKDPQVVARFMRECGTVVELEHPNTIKFYDFGQTDSGDLYIAMEFVDGHPLAHAIEKHGAMAFDRVDKIMRQVCGSLHEAHEKGVVHRDLKPENVILTNKGGETDFVKVLDFGIAKRHDAADSKKEQKLTQAGMVLGTPPYMSPEQFTGKELDKRSDIYSLGVMAYEMLTGQLPFKANTPWEWATQHMTAQPQSFEKTGPMAAQIPPHIKAACLRALSKDREERQTTAMQFYKELNGDGAAVSMKAQQGRAATEAFDAGAMVPVASGAGSPTAGARKGTGTQMGEPFTPAGVSPTAPGMNTAPGMPMMDMGGSVPGQMAPPVQHQYVPTAGGQAIPAPPAYEKGGGGKGLFIALAVLVAGGLAAGAYFLVLKPKPEESDPPVVALDEKKPDKDKTKDPEDPKPEDPKPTENPSGSGGAGPTPSASASDSSATEPDPVPSSSTPQPPQPPVTPGPVPDNSGEKACQNAISLAQQKRCPAAKSALASCRGSNQVMAQAQVASNCREGRRRAPPPIR
jgi:tRNA A-37 threonylcarbamoyl transferase component Bud32